MKNSFSEYKIYNYGKEITWSLPVLFEFEPVWGAIYDHLRVYGVDVPPINAYGSSANAWTGGRQPSFVNELDKNSLSKIFNYMYSVNATPTIVFSYTGITKDDLNDKYANYFLDAALEADARFIVYSDILKDYIKNKKPEAEIVASVIKPIFKFQGENADEWTIEKETNYYNKLLKEYNIVVVRPEYSKNVLTQTPEVIDDISRIEVLINQHCVENCPKAPAHYRFLDSTRFGVREGLFSCYRYDLPNGGFVYKKSVAHDKNIVQKLVDSGVRHLKLQGRSNSHSPEGHAMLLFSNMFNVTGPNQIIIEDLLHDIINNKIISFNNYMQMN